MRFASTNEDGIDDGGDFPSVFTRMSAKVSVSLALDGLGLGSDLEL